MPALKVQAFDGLTPRTGASELPGAGAQTADNVKLYARELRAWRGPVVADAAVSTSSTIFRYYNGGSPYFLRYAGDVDIVPGPLADTTEYRLYLTGRVGYPEKTNQTLLGTNAYQKLGLPAPIDAPTVAAAGGSGTTPEDRVYVYTNLNTFGSVIEESAPSPPSALVSVLPGGTVTVNAFTAVPGGYNITGRRIYRSVAGSTTDSYEFVAEIAIATTSYADTLTTLQLGAALGTIGWVPPPTDLKGLISVAGGFLAGFVGNTVYFSEPYFPHAWPLAYAITVSFPIVGLATYEGSVVLMTEKNPYVITGSSPGSLSAVMQPMEEPCVAKRTIAANENGVVYASPNGLIAIGWSFRGNVSRTLYTRDEWQALNPALMHGAFYASQYFGIFPALANGKALIFNNTDTPAVSRLDLNATAICVDARAAQLYYCATDGKIYQVDADAARPLNYVWRSRRYFYPKATSWSCTRIDADFGQLTDPSLINAQIAAIAAANATLFLSPLNGAIDETAFNTYDLNGSTLLNAPIPVAARRVQLLLYGDNVLQAVLDVSSASPLRIPAFKTQSFEFELSGNIDVRSIDFATTVPELFT